MEENKSPFDNLDRKRYYGLRVGDIIDVYSGSVLWGRSEVVELCPFDNNRVIIKSRNGNHIKWTAEECTVITKAEDKIK